MNNPDWLYVSRRLDLITLPARRAADVVIFGSTPYFRVTPAVVVWLEHAGLALAARDPDGEQSAIFAAAMAEVFAYCSTQFGGEELDAARRVGPKPLPKEEWCPAA